MAESKPDHPSGKHPTHHKETHGLSNDIDETTPISDVRGPNVFERAREEIEAIVETIHPHKEHKNHGSPQNGERDGAINTGLKPEKQSLNAEKHPTHHKETHGLSNDIDETTPISDVRGPNVFERAREEIEAIVETIHPHKEHKNHGSPPNGERDGAINTDLKPEKQSLNADTHEEKRAARHHKESHGTGDIDMDIPINEFKGPSIFDRAKEEVEALVETIHPKKESHQHVSSPKKEGGFRASIARKLEKICSPKTHNRD